MWKYFLVFSSDGYHHWPMPLWLSEVSALSGNTLKCVLDEVRELWSVLQDGMSIQGETQVGHGRSPLLSVGVITPSSPLFFGNQCARLAHSGCNTHMHCYMSQTKDLCSLCMNTDSATKTQHRQSQSSAPLELHTEIAHRASDTQCPIIQSQSSHSLGTKDS